MNAAKPLLLATPVVRLSISAAAQTPAVRDVPTYSIEQLLGTSNFAGISFSPDGEQILFTSDRSGVPNANVVPVAGATSSQTGA